MWSGGQVIDLGSFGGSFGQANGINTNGVVVGYSQLSPDVAYSTVHAFSWQNGVLHDVGTLPGDTNSAAWGVNANGDIVGISAGSQNGAIDGNGGRAFLYTGGTMYDLTSLLSSGTGWKLENAYAIKDQGQIVGIGISPNDGSEHGYILTPVQTDTTPPSISCASVDGLWHASDVSIACTASDSGSGLANPGDSSFSLSTHVATGTEDSNAATGSHQVCDNVGNCATAGPIAGNEVDLKPPAISISFPANQVYRLNEVVAAKYGCTDGGSGVGSCVGSVASGSNINTGSIGTKTFTVTAADKVGNAASQSVNYTVSYDIHLLYDPTKPTNTIELQLRDANGVNVSSSSIVLTAKRIDGTIAQSGTFSYAKSLAGYKYGLPHGLTSGPRTLYFTADSDPTLHSAAFTTR
jgi:probable HAF family extracellular repeat protein